MAVMGQGTVSLSYLLAWCQAQATVYSGAADVVRDMSCGEDVCCLIAQVSIILLCDLELLSC